MPVIQGHETVTGCDVSRWQGDPNYAVFDKEFVIYKATGGDAGLYVDGKFKQNAAGWTTVEGPYHFASDARNQAEVEADFFVNHLEDSAWWDMPWNMKLAPALDWEPTVRVNDGWGWCERFLGRLGDRTGENPFLYTGAYVMSGVERPKSLTKWRLWLAAYTPAPIPCAPWGLNWSIWQANNNGAVAGIKGGVDTDYMRLDVFQTETGRQPSQPSQPIPPQVHNQLLKGAQMLALRNKDNGGCWLVYANGDGVLVKGWIADTEVWKQVATQLVGEDLSVCDMTPNTASWLEGRPEVDGGAGFTH